MAINRPYILKSAGAIVLLYIVCSVCNYFLFFPGISPFSDRVQRNLLIPFFALKGICVACIGLFFRKRYNRQPALDAPGTKRWFIVFALLLALSCVLHIHGTSHEIFSAITDSFNIYNNLGRYSFWSHLWGQLFEGFLVLNILLCEVIIFAPLPLRSRAKQ